MTFNNLCDVAIFLVDSKIITTKNLPSKGHLKFSKTVKLRAIKTPSAQKQITCQKGPSKPSAKNTEFSEFCGILN